jgi:hypothetical protein
MCRCGATYLTGALEWDHLGDWERHHRVRDTFAIGLALSSVCSIIGVLICVYMRFVLDLRKLGFVVAVSIGSLPFILIQLSFWAAVVASMWRTRIGKSLERN